MLSTTAVLLFALAAPVEADGEPESSPVPELRTLEGTWEVVTHKVNGMQVLGGSRITTMVISGGKIDLEEAGKPDCPIKIDPTKRPKAIDVYLIGAMQAKAHVTGIYELKDGEFKLCLPLSTQADRPKKFSSQDYNRLYIMRRKK